MDKVQDVLNARLIAAGKHLELSAQYKKLKTDQERVVFTLNIMQEYDLVPNVTGMPKNAKESEKLREQGNKVFVKGIVNSKTSIDVLKLYTKSIAFAPCPSEQLALGYANRSAVLFLLGLHPECIQDIDRALALNYPDNLKAKLYLRKTECLMLLGNSSVDDMFKEVQYWLDKMSLNDTSREKLRTKLDILQDKSVKKKLCTDIKAQSLVSSLPTITSCNNEVPCASDAVAIEYNERCGRHVVATRDIRPGEVIAVEKPYSLILQQENGQTHCSNCLRVCWANIPCNYCTYAMYCSEECRNIEWKKCHDVECAVFPDLMEYSFYNLDLCSIRLAVLALREAGGIKELRTLLKEVDEHDDPRTKGFSQDGKLYSDRYIGVYSLVTNTEKRSVADLFKRSLDTSFILYLLATRTVIFGAKLSEDLSSLAENNDITFFGSLILRHQQTIPCNMHTVYTLISFGEMKDLEYVERGIASMPFLSLINHSCDPNVFRHSKPEHIVLYAMYPIKKGEQLLDNYGTHYAIMSKEMRQQKLLKQYYFTCDCIPCQEDWPLYHELKSYKTLVKKSSDKAKIKKALRKFNIFVNLATEGNIQDKSYIIEDLLKMVQVLHDCAPMPCEEMNNVIETLKRMYDLSGNIYEIPQVRT
ncbi:SET and MYND domain-containing protein 4 isoform X1 [Monomorium pharaonis]|uniref:SET and MYND domain-containing protein 4 isoform X1 n=1 Tax=Monomorium pharaonis TaxID=307658 RepID=UPI00174634BB|nr:SET and MYND domain-containing protein 4 isoform X1 [Monomorium pharaonis]XP_012538701.2 SET and MYND domain-containing protein 4 isoform X1 [Monomorium pharaonis]XP_012538703.2 SET and MYND domain-containing protein 4 isoform X1 [Monomorium pharaonis]XP_036147519.1 SET and MYND domain-containing protein 4 isoform X1 [Monomorium pharaonis]